MSEFQYKAFISYAHEDEKWASWLHRSLETYTLPKELSGSLKPIFRDREELAASGDLSSSIRRALGASESLIVICSPAAAKSQWVNEEIREFQSQGRNHRILCLIVDGVPHATDNNCFPVAFYDDTDSEPLAADCRKEGKNTARLRIIAGLLEIGFDQIVHRDATRRQRHLLFVTAGSIAVTVISAALAVSAYLANQEAQRQAATARKTTEFLSELYQAANPSQNQGKATTPEELLSDGLTRVAELGDQPSLQAELLHTIGSAYSSLGKYETAQELLEKSRDIRTRLNEQENLIVTLSDLGDLYQLINEYDKSERASLRALDIIQSLNDAGGLTPDEYFNFKMNTLSHYGQTLSQAQRFADAENVLMQVVENYEAVEAYPPSARSNLSLAHGSLGTTFQNTDRLKEAEDHFRLAIKLANEDESLVQVAGFTNNLSIVVKRLGRLEEAEKLYRESAELTERIFGVEHPKYAFVMNNLSMLLRDREKVAEAVRLQIQGYELLVETLGKEHPATLTLHSNLALLYFDQNRFEESAGIQREVLASRRDLFSGNHKDTVQSLVSLAEVLVALENPQEARDLADAAYKMELELASEYSSDAAWVNVIRGEILCSMGDQEAGIKLVAESCQRITDLMGESSGANKRCQSKLEKSGGPEMRIPLSFIRPSVPESAAKRSVLC